MIMETDQKHPQAQLDDLRRQIDDIDCDIVRLINKRLSIGSQIGRIKEKTGSMVLDKEREKKVLQRLSRINSGPADEAVLRYIFSVIMTATRQIQKSSRIAYLGPEASYTHIAALNHFKHSGLFVEQRRLRDVFQEVEKKECAFGVVPVENSIEGAVNHTLDLFCEFNLNIVAEHYEHISHDLLSVSGNLDDIQTIYSHPQAFAQARGWIREKLPHAKLVETSSTSRAARIAAREIHSAAVASSRAAYIYNLQVVESKIEDFSGNVTRFLVIGNEKMERTGHDKTSIMFATSHVPGALFAVLDPVRKAGINMVKLESRPTKFENWSYYFFMDIEGHFTDRAVADTLEEMKAHTLFLKVLGAYPVYSSEEIL